MIVEPFANDNLEDNLNPVGRVFYAASTMICTPASLSQEVGAGARRAGRRGAAAPGREEAGFTHFRRATETPFNMIFEARSRTIPATLTSAPGCELPVSRVRSGPTCLLSALFEYARWQA